ncbi:transposase [Xanthomonas oryzae pv. oryzae]|nr:transposase [Xanthomonas oryzae pv. oryzae]OLI53753.1 transposase [Xanthomonas oryzae pv. oryzae]
MQLTFGDAEYNGKRKRTRREVFLAEMDQVVPWKGLLALIEPHYPKSGQPGRQPYRLETMLRIRWSQLASATRQLNLENSSSNA